MENDSNIISLRPPEPSLKGRINTATGEVTKEEIPTTELHLAMDLRADFLEADEADINACHYRQHNFIQALAPDGIEKFDNPLADIKFKPDITHKVLFIIYMLADKEFGRITYAKSKIYNLYPQSEKRQSMAKREQTMLKNQQKTAYCLAKLDEFKEMKYGPYKDLSGQELEKAHNRLRQRFINDYKRSLRDPVVQTLSNALTELTTKGYIVKGYRAKKTKPGETFTDKVYDDVQRGVMDIFITSKTRDFFRKIDRIRDERDFGDWD